MSKKRLEEIDREVRKLDRQNDDLEDLLRKGGSIPSRLLERLAKSIGFRRPKKRTGEPIWKHPDGFSTAIPSHPAIKVTTAKKIIWDLQRAVFERKAAFLDEKERIKKQVSQFGSHY